MQNLPIIPYLDEICCTLKNSSSRFLVLTAETAAGKSTAVPQAILKAFPQSVIMLEPRRLAVLSIANRIAETLGEKVGQTVGYRMHLESKISKETRLEIITEAILTRKLQSDPSLEGISVVIIDEFHERSIHADLALAFLKEAMELRDDLYVIVMSATIETEKVAEYLGSKEQPAPVMKIPGRQFPVEIEYSGKISVSSAIITTLRSIKDKKQSILVFLPGIADIRRCKAELEEIGFPNENTELMILHSSITLDEQKKVLSPLKEGVTRIILSSSIAETSLTVPGVKTVIDSGLSRINRMNISLGMEHLVTENESMFSAEQRAGRAGRLGPGKCIRLWNKNDVRIENTPAEILRSDITSLVLECANWGVFEPQNLQWLDLPNLNAWKESVKLLELLGFLKNGKITSHGINALQLGLHPRLCATALSGFPQITVQYSSFSKSSPDIQKKYVNDIKQRISNLTENTYPSAKSEEMALLAGFPDRLAKQTATKGTYQFPSGRTAHLKKEEIQKHGILPEWIVVPEIDAGVAEGTIYSYHKIETDKAEEWLSFENRTEKRTITIFEGNKLKKCENLYFGKIILSSKQLTAKPEDYAAAFCWQVQQKGIETLPLNDEAKLLILREKFYAQQKNEESKSSDKNLSASVEEWLLPFLSGKTKIDEKTVYDALYWYLDGTTLDSCAPSYIILPNGKKRKITYELQSSPQDRTISVIRPVLEIIIQQIFGCFETPEILGMPVLLKLLSPARRPLQITDNLESFWSTTWPEICKEMKGRYPKHNWNYQIAEKD